MGRGREIALIVACATVLAACGGSSGTSTTATLEPSDVAVVGHTHITKAQLAHQIRLDVRAIELGGESCTGGSQGQEDCGDRHGSVPPVGTEAYRSAIVQPVVTYLVLDAQLHAIGRNLGIDVTPGQVRAAIAKNIQQLYAGDEAKYHADLARYRLTDADVRQQVELSLLEQRIDAKLKSQVTVTPQAVAAYYTAHRADYEVAADTRAVSYVLEPSRAAAAQARAAIASGKSFADLAAGAIDDSSRHEPFVATRGAVDQAFAAAAFGLPTDTLSPLVRVEQSYVKSQPSLRGKCKPTCYFVIRPTGDTVKAGTQKPFAAVRAQITQQLNLTLPLRHVQLTIARLEKQQNKVTRYAHGYAPSKPHIPATGVPDTSDTTAPAS
ncbi:MAG: peptidyl-prolyl cis-trans isomerase [Jatrophihabitantaceae bacterium]